ncbi:MAG TPA: ABC transporter substrate-binding protein [Telmatospirillum sp.]|nr:ABC transporter substrate-binding protein [Telmatospirillum sp.]
MYSRYRVAFFLRFLLVLAVVSFAGNRLARAEDGEEAGQLVAAIAGEAMQTFAGTTLTPVDRVAKLRDFIDKYGDFRLSGREVLGRYWDQASPAQQERFGELFRDYVLGSWSNHLTDIPSGQHIDVVSSEVNASGRILVHSRAVTPTGSALVDWTVVRGPAGRLAVIDVTAEGVSVIRTMKADFTAIIRANGGSIEALLDVLGKKVADFHASTQ